MTPYILLGLKELPQEDPPKADVVYDEHRQLWIDMKSGLPLVSCMQNQEGTQYGETTITRTREGADQTEGAIQASRFGETTQTHTVEGIDQTEVTAVHASQFGETITTKTREGTDQSEGGSQQDFDASYSHF